MPQPPRGKRPDERRGPRTGTPREPIGLDRAVRTPGAPPRKAVRPTEVPARPDIPEDARADLPREVKRDLRRTAGRPEDADEVMIALTLGTRLLEEREGEAALPYLRWAKHLAPRAGAVREALGVALYLAEQYDDALAELQTYRRVTGRPDQNHVLADCHRALGRGTDKVAALVEEMRDDGEVPLDRRIEGIIVWASTLADAGDLGAGRAVLRPMLDETGRDDEPTEAHLRLWYVAGDLSQRSGDHTEARRWFTRIDEAADGFFDVTERLARL